MKELKDFSLKIDICKLLNNKGEFNEKYKKKYVTIAGRIKKIRSFGGITFLDLEDHTGCIQLKIIGRKENNMGDIIVAKGYFCRTTGKSPTIEVKTMETIRKCLRYISSEYYSLKDVEERFRKRYLDFINNKRSRETILIRSKIIKEIRNYLWRKNFVEIETPILVSEASGAEAKPFITYHNKLQKNFFLRIATEIPLKKLLVGGVHDKIFEIGKVFRNEGKDKNHSPEFTTIEIYAAYKNSVYMMKITEDIIKYIAKKILKSYCVIFDNKEINIENFRKLSMTDSINEKINVDFKEYKNYDECLKLAEKFGVKLENFQNSRGHVIYSFFEKFVEKELICPTIIYDFPIEISPLSKEKNNEDGIVDRFEVYINGMEFANGYSELDDPKEQEKRFNYQLEQKKMGNEEIGDIDRDFIEALEYGMPPAGGLGIGIDRLIMFFTNNFNINEVIAFPQLKDKN